MSLRPRDSALPALLALVGANLLPLAGVLFGGWTVWEVLIVYWIESGIVGLFSIPRILLAAGSSDDSTFSVTINGRPVDVSGPETPVDGLHVYPENVPIAGFFCMHYGIFWVVHGVFVLSFPLFLGGGGASVGAVGGGGLGTLIGTFGTIGLAIVGLVVSHGVSFVTNYVGREEYRHTSAGERMSAPYGRVVVLHVTIIVGAFLVGSLGGPLPALVLLVVLKTGIDLGAHLREHRRASGRTDADEGLVIEVGQ
ncbi:DUF6498-containing protein [Salinirubrum litoreum]|uniref:DUF6498-containing protein n=1 Tax=Salinirubrum litoreum TaxID=1126234 RepID=A0ABD5RCH2_9EURY|nr:DUF6498-containing protein [Salinirubrum litoreum]